MENSSITIVKEFKNGKIKNNDSFVTGIWKAYTTDQQNIILLRAFINNDVKEITYDASLENFAEALNRIMQSK